MTEQLPEGWKEAREQIMQKRKERTARVMQRLRAIGIRREQAILATLPFAQQIWADTAVNVMFGENREEAILEMMEYASQHTP